MPNAAVAGMHDDLNTDVGYRYSIATLVCYLHSGEASSVLETLLTKFLLPGVLRHVHHLPAASNSRDLQNRTAKLSTITLRCVGLGDGTYEIMLPLKYSITDHDL